MSTTLRAAGLRGHAPMPSQPVARRRIRVTGVVQGVGFRPFVWALARRHGVGGWVRNTSGAVIIEVEGPESVLDAFMAGLRVEAPPLARIATVEDTTIPIVGATDFHIEASCAVAGEHQPVPPDAATCAECRAELFDSRDRRFRYPFINCTNCGPRFTIIEDIPYDRPRTTMRHFPMCATCEHEYRDPANRRFHAQPNACPVCGPRLWFADVDGNEQPGDAIALSATALASGAIVALKGMGGFQLACDATDEAVLQRLRRRKHRPSKPFAIMVRDVAAARLLCEVSASEAAVLESTAAPVVLLPRRRQARVAASVAPFMHELGVMLPSTPLHHLLLDQTGMTLVMTSGNVSEEPIVKDNDEAVTRLGGIADSLLLHDRGIYARYDDSVVRLVDDELRTIRRARGYCPLPIEIGEPGSVLALGAHLKNTMCVVRDGRAFVGPHIGDLDTPLAMAHHGEVLTTYLRLFGAEPEVVAADLHPDYASTTIAERWWDGGAIEERVQHHHAHIAGVMAEHHLRGPVIGVALDGAGLGTDGTIWGGEFLVCDEVSSQRAGHLTPVPQPGGDRCAREGWRMAAAYLEAAGQADDAPPPWMGENAPDSRRWRLVRRVAATADAAPITTSAGRLFDAVASLLGIAHSSSFEGEAAMRLEATASSRSSAVRPIEVRLRGEEPLVVDTAGLVAALVDRRAAGEPAEELAAVFHESLALVVARGCARIAATTGLDRVALSGGVFQNALLLRRTTALLRDHGLIVYVNSAIPANDGGISLGQALVAAARQRALGRLS